jgi:hypothetical protein
MNLQQAQGLFEDYLEGGLDKATRQAMDLFIAGDKVAARELQEFKGYREKMRALQRVPAPANFLVQVRQRLEKKSLWERILNAVFVAPARQPRLAGAVLSVILVVTVFLSYYKPWTGSPLPAEVIEEKIMSPLVPAQAYEEEAQADGDLLMDKDEAEKPASPPRPGVSSQKSISNSRLERGRKASRAKLKTAESAAPSAISQDAASQDALSEAPLSAPVREKADVSESSPVDDELSEGRGYGSGGAMAKKKSRVFKIAAPKAKVQSPSTSTSAQAFELADQEQSAPESEVSRGDADEASAEAFHLKLWVSEAGTDKGQSTNLSPVYKSIEDLAGEFGVKIIFKGVLENARRYKFNTPALKFEKFLENLGKLGQLKGLPKGFLPVKGNSVLFTLTVASEG